jgi:isovaleryl-CoA dehydrogenase
VGRIDASVSTSVAEQADIRETIRRWAQDEVAPLAREIDRDQRFPIESWKRGAELGVLGMSAPEEYGGAGLGLPEMCIVSEELAAACMSTAATLQHQSIMVVDSLVRNGTEDQKKRYLPQLCDGSWVSCLAITEPESGSDALSMRTTATRAEGGWTLNGSKTFITNGPSCDMTMVYAKTGAVDSREIGLFIVESTYPGFTKGAKMEKMGWRGSETCELFFDDVFVPEENLVGGEGNGLRVLMSGLNSERILMAAQAVGISTGAFEACVEHARERRQFGRPIGEFQLIRAKLADMYCQIEAVRALVDKAIKAWAEEDESVDMRLIASAVKILAGDLVNDVTSEAVQIFGGYGFIQEYPLERYMRDAKLFQIGGGTSEILRDLMGRALVSVS